MPNSDVSAHNETRSENIFGVSLLSLMFLNNIIRSQTYQTGKKHVVMCPTKEKGIVFLVWGKSR